MDALAWAAKWWVDSALAAMIVLGLGALLLRFIPQPVRRQRLGEWALAGCLLVAVLAGLPGLPRWSLGFLDPVTLGAPLAKGDMRGIEAFGTATLTGPVGETGRPGITINVPPSGAQVTPKTPVGALVIRTLLIAYGLCVLVALTRFIGGLWTLRRLAKQAAPPDAALATLWHALTSDLQRKPTLGVTRDLPEPVSFGVWHSTVLIPKSLVCSGNADALRIVLMHELVHVRRRDALTWLLAGIVQILFYYQPAYWWLRRELRLAQEYIADAWAAEVASSAHHYAASLLALLQGKRAPVPAVANEALGMPSLLYRRMERLLSQARTERACGWKWTGACGLLVLALTLGAGNVTLRARETKDANKPNLRAMELQGIKYLLGQQGPNGGWLEEVGPAPTALVLKAFLQAGVPVQHPQVQQGLKFIERYRHSDHGYYRDDEPAYNTAIVLSLLTMLPDETSRQHVTEARAFLEQYQKPPLPRLNSWYAGGTFGKTLRPSWADRDERGAGAVLETYGRMTYAGLKSMVYAGLEKDDQRVKLGAKWLAANWTLNCNAGMGTAEGQFYYYHMLAKTLHAAGTQEITDRHGTIHNWREELQHKLSTMQREDGSWVNSQNARWLEDRPALVTAYSVLAIQETRP